MPRLCLLEISTSTLQILGDVKSDGTGTIPSGDLTNTPLAMTRVQRRVPPLSPLGADDVPALHHGPGPSPGPGPSASASAASTAGAGAGGNGSTSTMMGVCVCADGAAWAVQLCTGAGGGDVRQPFRQRAVAQGRQM